MMINYLSNNNYNRQLETWTVGGAGGGYTYNTEIDKKEWFMRSQTGFSGAHFNQMVIIEP
jgi:FMN-dependent NADH-azoreductase